MKIKGLLLFAVCASLSLNSKAQTMSGTYYIGGSGANFTSLKQAIDTVSARGVSGHVTFRVRPGTYSDQLLINNIATTAANRTITFMADSLNAAPVIVTSNNTSNSMMNFTLRLNNSRFIQFKHIRFTNASTIYPRVIELYGTSKRCVFDSCDFIGYNFMTSSSQYANIYFEQSSISTVDSITFKNSLIKWGSIGVYLYGISQSSPGKGNTFDNCRIHGFGYYGIYAYYQKELTVKNSQITTDSASYYAYALMMYYTESCRITGNKIDLSRQYSLYGLYLFYPTGSSSNKYLINNNMITLRGQDYLYGTYMYSPTYVEYAFNSLHAVSGYGGYVFYMYASSTAYPGNTLYNNNFINQVSGLSYPVYIYASGSGVLTSNRNNYRTNSLNLGYYTGTICSDLAAWKWAATPNEANSVSVDPEYRAANDLHSSSIDLFGKGQSVSGITTDFDGQARHATAPCIGADEFTIPQVDAGIKNLTQQHICAGQFSATAILKNYGRDSLSYAKIHWAISTNNGTFVSQTTLTYAPTAKLPPGGTANISLGNYTYASGNSYRVRIFSDSVNHVIDSNKTNDTLNTDIYISMSGTFTVGGTSPDYASITAAITDLNSKGVCGPVTFLIRPGNYTSSWPTINQVPGTAKSKSVTFRNDPITAGTVTFSNNTDLVTINGSSYLKFKNLRFIQTGYGGVVKFSNNVNEIDFDSCYFKGIESSSQTTSYAIFYDNSGSTDVTQRLRIRNCEINHTSTVMYKYGNSGSPELGFEFVNNKVSNFNYMGFYFFYQDSLVISGNTFADTNIAQSYIYGTYLYMCSNMKKYKYNHLELDAANATYGCYLNNNLNTSSAPVDFSNNYIALNSFGANGSNYALYLSYCNYYNMSFNTIRMNGGSSSSYNLYTYYGTGHNLKNNNIANFGGGYNMYVYFSGTSNLNTSDYNNMYSGTSNFGYYYPSTITSLAAWRSASSKDQNSVSTDPFFENGSSGVPTSVILDSAATPITGITTDLAGRTRQATHPDIGAYEFDVIFFDASSSNTTRDTVCPSEEVYVQIKNEGYANLSNVTIEWSVSVNSGSFVAQAPVVVNAGGLAKDDSMNVNLGKYPFVFGSQYRIKAYTHSPNGRLDQRPDADTHQTTIRVYNTPTVSISGLPSFCETDGPYIMTQGSPAGGWFDGPGAFKSYFRPRIAGAGTHLIHYYWADANGCAGHDSTNVIVHPGPVITMPSVSRVCPNQPSFMLTGYSPSGGTWTGGAWLSGTTFLPANAVPGANNWIKYKVVSTNGCADSSTKWIRLDTLPVVSLTNLPKVCENGTQVLLSGGKPVGGQYSGTGVSGSNFDPALVSGAGLHPIRYAYTDGLGCSDSVTANLTVEAKPAVNLPATAVGCPRVNPTISVNNPGMKYLWSTGDTTESIVVKEAKSYQVTVTDPNTTQHCKNEGTIAVSFDDVCAGIKANPHAPLRAIVYPNPSAGKIALRAENISVGKYTLRIFSMSGIVVLDREIMVEENKIEIPLDIAHLAAGSYLLRLQGDEGYFQTPINIK